MSKDEQYICAISGRSAAGTEDDEDQPGIPLGWARVTVSVRTENPEHRDMVRVRNIAVETQLSQVKDEAEREKNRPIATVLARASFAALEQITPQYLDDEEQLFVSAEHLSDLRKLLGQEDE